MTKIPIIKKVPPKRFLTIKEVSNLLGVTPLTLRNWDNSGKLKAYRHPINNYRIYKPEKIELFFFFIMCYVFYDKARYTLIRQRREVTLKKTTMEQPK